MTYKVILTNKYFGKMAIAFTGLLMLIACGAASIRAKEDSNIKDFNKKKHSQYDGLFKTEDGQSKIQKKDSLGADTTLSFKLETGLTIKVRGKTIYIGNSDNNVAVVNSFIVRTPDENKLCPADGFFTIVCKGEFFTIEQQTCSGWFTIQEFITFRYIQKNKKAILHKFILQYTDRRAPEKNAMRKIYSQKNFGTLYFENVKVDSLYLLLRQ